MNEYESFTNYPFPTIQPLEVGARQEFTANQSHQKDSFFGYKPQEIALRPDAPEFIPSWLKEGSNSNLSEAEDHCQCVPTFTPNFQVDDVLKSSRVRGDVINEREQIRKSSVFDLNKVVDAPAFEPGKHHADIVKPYQDLYNNNNKAHFHTDKSHHHQNSNQFGNGAETHIVEPQLHKVKNPVYPQVHSTFHNISTTNYYGTVKANPSQNYNTEYETRKAIDGNIGYGYDGNISSTEIVHSNQSRAIESPNSTSRPHRNYPSQEYKNEDFARSKEDYRPSRREHIESRNTGSKSYASKLNKQRTESIPSETNNPNRNNANENKYRDPVELMRYRNKNSTQSLKEHPLNDISTCGVPVESKTSNQGSIGNHEKEVIEKGIDKIVKNDDSHESIDKPSRENSKLMRYSKREVYESKNYTKYMRDSKGKNFNNVDDERELDENAEKISQWEINHELLKERFKNQNHSHAQNRTAISEYNKDTVNSDTSTLPSEFEESARIDKGIRSRHSFGEYRDYEKRSTEVLFTGRRSDGKPRDLKQERGYQKTEISNELTSVAQMFDKTYAEEDDEYKQFLEELQSKTTPDFSKIQEENRDLFDMPEDWSLAHCVAEDLRMGSGIAVVFRNVYNHVDILLNQHQKPGGLACLKLSKKYIFYLITKTKSNGKPTYKDFWCSMKKLRDVIKQLQVVKLAVPALGCGLDRLDWFTVKHMISFLFKDIPINIVVCKFRQNEEEPPSNYRSVKFKNVKDSICNATESVLLYFTTLTSHISEEMIELDKKFNFLQHLRSETKGYGSCVVYRSKNIILCGCLVRKTIDDRFDFVSFRRSLEEVKKHVKDNIAVEYIIDENDDLLFTKVITVLLNTFKDITVNIYKGNFDVSFGEL
ncbi:uncharacterized protein LOC114330619 [Diabrotica virgifera virgifera]|nr:uncharacterized protein LOC114330619 [Diabrotica virgifera virgifera]